MLGAWHFDHAHTQRLRPAARAALRSPTAGLGIADRRHGGGHIVRLRRRNFGGGRTCSLANGPGSGVSWGVGRRVVVMAVGVSVAAQVGARALVRR